MADCVEFDFKPFEYTSGLILYYNSSGECYDGPTSNNLVRAVAAEVASATATEIKFLPKPGTAARTLRLDAWCGAGNGGEYETRSAAGLVLIVQAPAATGTTWGWDFDDDQAPPRIIIKVRVKRI
ncbi:hypothetical protein OV203_05170 [Nannocystis sp. ILAH1]|uniref:hypothetical protein n=1 Tax=unclassified Nannocystis TaxID=2627009 RepID=UPI002271CF05|nr:MULTISPECIES: hypothetical protein [unclassified Nannocystis]MCY0986497.1 hypothetical protein [Nannocystis sp. ILAH1]MCY1071372.1 hypothetical protein [Nannocystis sp. RBIL2]